VFQRVIYKRSWWDLLRGKVFAAGGFLRSAPGVLYTENVGRYYIVFGIASKSQENLYYMVDGVLVNSDCDYELPAWMLTSAK